MKINLQCLKLYIVVAAEHFENCVSIVELFQGKADAIFSPKCDIGSHNN